MDWNKLKFTKVEQEIVELLFRKPTTTFNGKEIALQLKVSPTAVANALKKLKKEQIVHVQKRSQLLIRLNRDEREIFILKRMSNFKEMYTSGLVAQLAEQFPSATLVVFGSYAQGEDTEESDIDIAIIGYEERKLNLEKIGTRVQRKIQLQFYKNSATIPKNIKENIYNGIILKGVLQL